MFEELKREVKEIISVSNSKSMATERIMRLVSSKISVEAGGYLVDMYISLANKIKNEDYFKNPEKLNAFYRLNLREELSEKYQFNIEDVDTYKKGIEYKEINQIYTAVGASIGTLAVGGILKSALSSTIGIPFTIIIAGAFITAFVTSLAVHNNNKQVYKKSVDNFLNNLENDILNWLVDIEIYFDGQVRSLYK